MDGLDLPSLLDAEQLLTTMGQSVIVIDHLGIIVSWSAASCELFGWSAEEAIGQHGQVLLVPVGLVQNVEQIAADLRAGRSWTGGFTTQHKDGSMVRVLSTNTPILHSDGSLKALIVLSASLDAALDPLLANSSDATVVVGLEGLIHFASHATTRLYGWAPGELVGQHGFSLIHPEDSRALSRAIAACLRSGQHPAALPSVDPVEVRVKVKDGSWRWTEVALSNMKDHPAVRGTVLNLRDVSDRRAAHDRLRHLSEHDAVTDLPNRQWMAEQIQYGHPQRGTAGAVLLVKVTGLRELNHRFGHVAGDDLLRRLGAMLSASLGPQDLCGSLGGGEFLVLLQDAHDRAATGECVGRIQAALHQGLPIGASTVIPSTHIGVTLLAGRRRAHELIREVVTAAEQARCTGPRRWLAFDELGTDNATGGVLAELTAALAADELRVHYQPVVALDGRSPVGVEALVRWQHPSRGLLSPHAFLEAAEDTDLINDIGAFVLHQACRQVASWPGETLTVAVNVSARQLADSGLVQVIESALAQAGLAAQRLVLEITETALLQDLGVAVAVLGKCRALGVRVAIDDFGTGFAGFGYLRELPIDEIKIDRSFVAGLGVENFDSAIVGGIIHMAQALGLRTIAEGIETARQAELLTDLGCDLGQGYLWSPAVPGDEAALLAAPGPA